MSEEVILEIKNLSVFLEKEEIIKNLSLKVRRGEVLTILGPNGAGKTTFLRALLGIVPYKGEIRWAPGIKLGYVPQRVPFVKDFPLTVEEFLRLKELDSEKINRILNSLGFPKTILKKNIGNLSSGQYQRILVVWALLKNPDVLLFDEPTTGIDIAGEETIYRCIERLKKEKNLTIILVTHDLSVVFKFSDYVVCLHKTPICQGVPKEVVTPQNLSKLYGEEIKFYQHH